MTLPCVLCYTVKETLALQWGCNANILKKKTTTQNQSKFFSMSCNTAATQANFTIGTHSCTQVPACICPCPACCPAGWWEFDAGRSCCAGRGSAGTAGSLWSSQRCQCCRPPGRRRPTTDSARCSLGHPWQKQKMKRNSFTFNNNWIISVAIYIHIKSSMNFIPGQTCPSLWLLPADCPQDPGMKRCPLVTQGTHY